jgi:type IV secretion system protein TrbI
VAGLGAVGLLQPVLSGAGTPALPGTALAGLDGQYGGGLALDVPQVPAIDVNGQRSKQAFLAQPGATGDSDYLQASLKPPVSPFEVQAGAVIPAVMIGDVVSDLPGQLIAQVAETVYDSVTGNVPLIPQGSRLVGTYDNQVAAGQTRVLVAWNRVIFPNGWSIDIGQMPGADQGGYAGFHDQVNNHFWQIFGNAVMLSLFGAGIQLSQPQASGFQNVGAGHCRERPRHSVGAARPAVCQPRLVDPANAGGPTRPPVRHEGRGLAGPLARLTVHRFRLGGY